VSVVDDDLVVRQATANLLLAMGVDVLTFGSAQEFIASGRIAEVSCLITDVRMPGLSGLDLQQQLIADRQNMPVIFMTAFASDSDRKQALESGAVGFLNKPFSDKCLRRCLDKALCRP
jgi:FixJ family two-component response regulator